MLLALGQFSIVSFTYVGIIIIFKAAKLKTKNKELQIIEERIEKKWYHVSAMTPPTQLDETTFYSRKNLHIFAII